MNAAPSEAWIDAYLDEELTADAAASLGAWIAADERHAAEFLRRVELHWAIRANVTASSSLQGIEAALADEPPQHQGLVRTRLTEWMLDAYDWINTPAALGMLISGLLMTIILLSLALWTVPEWRPGATVAQQPTTDFVARISNTSAATFDDSSGGNFQNRDLFDDDTIVLNSGLAVIEYDTGARVVIEGPAMYQVQGANGGDLRHGKLVARVETKNAQGFAVAIPGGRVIDLGTEFGVEVAADGTSQVAVLDGEVEVVGEPSAAGAKQRMRLAAGEAVSVDPTSGTITLHGDTQVARFTRLSADLRSMQHPALLRVDFQNSSGKNVPAGTQPGFVSLTDRHATGAGTASATFSTRNGRVTVALSGLDSTLSGFFNREPGISNSDTLTAAAIYNDFAFKNSGSGQSLQLTLSGDGIAANTDYSLTFYSYDAGVATGNVHTVRCEGIDGTVGEAPPIVYTIGAAPATNEQYSTTGTFTSDESGVLKMELTDTFTGSPPDGIRLNAIELNAVRAVD